MSATSSIGASAIGGAVCTVATAIAYQVWGLKFDSPEIQAALQTLFVAGTVGFVYLVKAIMAKLNLKEPPESGDTPPV